MMKAASGEVGGYFSLLHNRDMGRGQGDSSSGTATTARRDAAEHIDVAGSNAIKTAVYNPGEEELAVTYTSGSMYAYTGVPREEVDAFREADSKGGYLTGHIKGKYPFRLVLKEHASVDSSVIRQIDYDSSTEEVRVTFVNGKVGRYAGVP